MPNPASRLGDRSNSSVKMFGKQCECSGECGTSACSECGRSEACADLGRRPHGSIRSLELSRRRRGPMERQAPVPPRVLALCSTLPVPCRPLQSEGALRWVGWAQRRCSRWWQGGACIILLRPAADNNMPSPRGQCCVSEGGSLTRVLSGRWHLLLHAVRLRHHGADHHGLDGGVR